MPLPLIAEQQSSPDQTLATTQPREELQLTTKVIRGLMVLDRLPEARPLLITKVIQGLTLTGLPRRTLQLIAKATVRSTWIS